MKRIDSHQHYWLADRGDYHWMTAAVAPLCRDFMPAELAPILRRHGIDQTVIVQAAAKVAETDFLLSLADVTPSAAGVVGWLDLDADDFPRQFDGYRRHQKFIGLRPMLQDLPDDRWILRDRVQDHLSLVEEAGFPFEFLTYTRHLPHVLTTMERHPQLRAVIDHLSKPPIKSRQLQPWQDLMARLASEHPAVRCKLSGYATEADHRQWRTDDFRPYMEHVWASFGPQRLMFGSDWPVCTLAATYDEAMDIVVATLGTRLDAAARAALFGGNATAFYHLPS